MATNLKKTIEVNCDMGESFGIFRIGNDEEIMPYITQANIACGFHASDPNHMRKTVELAQKYKIKAGAHFSLPDLNGFGRREMKIEPDELENIVLYQIGALKSFLDLCGVKLNHLKPHGSLYGMASRQRSAADAITKVAKQYGVPLFGIQGTKQQKSCESFGVQFQSEFFADLNYDQDGHLIISRSHPKVDPQLAAERCLRLVEEETIVCNNGSKIPMKAETICFHSDTPNALEIAHALHKVLKPFFPEN